MSDIAKLGFSVDTTGLKAGEKALDKFASTGEKTEKRTDKSSKKIVDDYEGIEKAVGKTATEVVRAERNMVKAQKESEKQLRKRSRSLGQASIQFQQFIGQIQGGQGVMLALSQQGADLGIVLDRALLGSIVGISASIAGLLLPTLFKTTSSMKDLEKAMESVNKTATDTDGIKSFTKEISRLANESEKSARLLILAAEQSASEAGRAAAKGISEGFNDVFDVTFFQASFDALKTIAGTAGGTGFTISKAYRDLGEQFGLTGVAAREAGIDVLVSLREMEQAVNNNLPNAGDKIIAFQEKLADLAEKGIGGGNAKLLEFVNLTSEFTSKAKLAAEMAKFLQDTLESSELELITDDTKKLSEAIDGVSSSLMAQIVALRDGEEAAVLWSISQRLNLKDGEAIPDSIRAQITELKNLRNQQEDDLEFGRMIAAETKVFDAEQKKGKADSIRDFDKLTKSIENFGGTWSKTGSVIVDAFGDISDAMGDYMSQLSAIEKNEKSLAAFRAEKGADNLEVIALQQKLEADRVSADLSGMKALSKAGASLFDEKTVAAKSFAALNKIITIAEIALSFQKMIAKTTETGVVVANNTTQQASNGLTAITAAFAAPFPVGFVAGAAMIGIMASLLGSGSGGGSFTDPTESRQETQGTGSVLGSSDKSESILESQERFEDIQIDQLSELRGIRTSLGDVASGIALVTRNLIAGGGLGEFGGDLSGSNFSDSNTGSALSGGLKIATLGLSSIGGLGDKFITSLFGSVKKSVTDSGIQFIASSLGDVIDGGILEAQQFFDITTKKKKFFGLSKKTSTSTELEDLDSSFSASIGAIFQSIGAVVSESASLLGFDVKEALNAFQVDIGQISLEGLSGEEIEAELQAVFSQQADLIAEAAIPSLIEFQKVGEGLFETLTRVTQEQTIFNDSIKVMGFNLSELSNVMQIDVAQSIIGLTGGLERFSDLSNSFIDQFFTDAEKFTILEDSISDVFDSLGLSMVSSKEDFRGLVEGIDLTTQSGQELFATLLQISPAFSEYIDQLEDQVAGMVNLSEAAENAFSMLEKAIQLDRQRAAASLDIAREAHNAELSRVDGLRLTLEAENQLRNANLVIAEDMLNKSFNSEIQLIQSISEARISGLNDEKAAFNQTASSMKSLISNLDSSLGLSGGTDLVSALEAAISGDFSKAEALNVSGLVNLDPKDFLSAEAFSVQEALNRNRLKIISDLASEELTEAEKSISAIEKQIEATESASNMQVEKLTEQLNTLLGIDAGIVGIDDAIKEFQEAQKSVDELGYQQELERLDMLVKSANDVFSLHEQAYSDELERLDAILADNEDLLNAALGIDESVLSVADAVIALNKTILSISSGKSIPSAPFIADNSDSRNSSVKQEEIKEELQKTREDNEMFQRALIKSTKRQEKILQQINMTGIEIRT